MAPDLPLETLIGKIYDAALDPAGWSPALAAISHEMRAESTHLFGIRPDGAPVFGFLGGNQGEAGLADYHAYFHAVDPRVGPTLELPPGRFVPQATLVAPRRFRRSEFFNDFYRPLGLRDMAGAVLMRRDDLIVLMGIHRGIGQPTFDETGIATLDQLAPHLTRAVTLAERIGALKHRQALCLDALNRLNCGVIAVDERGRPLMVNDAAARLDAAGDGLHIGPRALTGTRPPDTHRLAAAIAGVVGGKDSASLAAHRLVTLSRPTGRRALEVLVTPGSSRHGLGAALVFVADPAQDGLGREEALTALYELTAAEARIALRLADGDAPAAIAEALHLSVETVRWTLKQVYAKTGVASQAGLVSFLSRGIGGGALDLD